MKIEAYTFGSITVNGEVYHKDLIIFPDRVRANWWRKEGHSLCVTDLKEAIKARPEMLIIGKGAFGSMNVPLATELALKEKNIELVATETERAAEFFNEQVMMGKKVVGAFHLTC